MFDVRGKNVIVTGASKGFGYEFSRRLAMAGAKVCLSDIKVELGQESAANIRKMLSKDEKSVFFIKCDVSIPEDWVALWDEAEKIFGGQVDILCNNAGVPCEAGWKACIDIMASGFTHGLFLALDRMGSSKGGHGGRIINTASVAGLTSGYLGNIQDGGYNIAKWGNVVATRLFTSSSPNPYETDSVKCYALCPWFADTDMVRPIAKEVEKWTKHRILTPEEVGDALMKSLELDKNGAVYTIFPDVPLVEYTSMRNVIFAVHILFAKVAARLGIQVLTPVHFCVLAFLFLWLAFTFFNRMLDWMVWGCD